MDVLTLDRAVETILNYVTPIEETETVPVFGASGRILAEDLTADFDNPPFPRSPVDGYACRAEDLAGATRENPVSLKVLCEIDAGGYSEIVVKNGEAVRIMTGAAIPDGCNCCIYQEKTDYGEETVRVYAPVKPWQNYCDRGDDFKEGTVLVKKGTRITHVEAAVFSSAGETSATVFRLPKVAILTTGDEVTEPGKELRPGKIYNSNGTLLAVRMQELGAIVTRCEMVADDPKVMADALKAAASEADFVVTTGGVSVGKKDILHEATRLAGAKRVFWKLALKPGMPTLFTVLDKTPVLSLSGNPFGVAVTAEVLIRPMLEKLKKDRFVGLHYVTGVFHGEFKKTGGPRRMVRAVYREGEFFLTDQQQSNGVLASMAGCNCLIDIPAGSEPLKENDTVRGLLL